MNPILTSPPLRRPLAQLCSSVMSCVRCCVRGKKKNKQGRITDRCFETKLHSRQDALDTGPPTRQESE